MYITGKFIFYVIQVGLIPEINRRRRDAEQYGMA